MDNSDSNQQHVSDEIENGINEGASTARTAKRVISNAAAGNAAGVALSLLENEKIRKLVIGAIAFLLFLILVVMYMFPMSVYEGVQTIMNDAGDAYWSAYYSAEGGKVFKGAWSFVTTFLSGVWANITSTISQYTNSSANSFYLDSDITVLSRKDSPADALYAKLTAAKDKYTVRKKEIISAIETQGYEGAYSKAYSYFLGSFDSERDIFNGFIWDESGCHKELSDMIALKLAVLYGLIYDNDFSNTRLADYMQWLGYEDNNGSKCSISVFGSKVNIGAWTGTYMPQYLHDEADDIASTSAKEIRDTLLAEASSFDDYLKAKREYTKRYREEYEKYTSIYGAPAIDLVIKAYVSSAMTSTCQVAYRYMPEYSGTYTKEERYTNPLLLSEIEKYSDPDEGYITETEYKSTTYAYVYHSKYQVNEYYYDSSKQQYYSSTHNGQSMPYRWDSAGGCYLPFEQDYVYICFYQSYRIVTYTAYINVMPRSADTLIKLTGLTEGSKPYLSDEQYELTEAS